MSKFRLHAFKVDVTPPVGEYLCGGLHGKSTGIEQRIHLRGGVLTELDAAGAVRERVAIAVVDYCYICGRSQRRIEEALARGAGVPATKAAVQSNHVHDVPLIDEEAHALMDAYTPGVHSETYFARVLRDVESAVSAAVRGGGVEIGGVSFTSCKVSEFASSRRVLGPDGRCLVRWSVCRDDAVRSAPEGRIDPLMDMVVFHEANTGKPAACWGFYASHPQVSDGRGLVSGDTVGIAMELFEQTNAGIAPVYFTGCAGDITAGKYTTTNRPRNRHVFGIRLYDGFQGAFDAARAATPQPLRSLAWADHTAEVPLAPIHGSESDHLAKLRDPAAPSSLKYLSAMKIDRHRRNLHAYPFRVSRLRINDHALFFAPSELVVEYQFHAKRRCGGKAMIAAYGDSFLKYIAHDRAFDEGGYEVDPLWSEVGKGIESHVKRAIDRVV